MFRYDIKRMAKRLSPQAPIRWTPDGYQKLVEAICRQARRDLLGHSYYWKFDAMNFFRSSWFEFMTGLDGEYIIQKLLGGDE